MRGREQFDFCKEQLTDEPLKLRQYFADAEMRTQIRARLDAYTARPDLHLDISAGLVDHFYTTELDRAE